ncbi:hypothetical protein P5G50_02490 [Leifsonia sp. F6_8S_P_1B]|uniref:Uncharacterized protein n=1 Tax=Leifsonia williamsii TaxID=3035919 RepID=A0ABT8K780_9MICO|nr:hypothetical protein [Leifsonia williamsii]MDN4613310.1 hypothetical protein [Leifsonia williamsii]
MKRIHYASGSLLTGDAIAEALVAYAAALAINNAAAEVHAPAVMENGQQGEVLMLLGPASQILVDDGEGDDLVDTEFVADIEQKTQELGPRKATFVESGTEDAEGIDLDFL